MIKLKSLCAAVLASTACVSAQAYIAVWGEVRITSIVVRDGNGNQADPIIAIDAARSSVSTSETLHGEDYLQFYTNSFRLRPAALCTSAPVVPGIAMTSTACSGGITGSWTASLTTSAAPSEVLANADSHWNLLLQPGQTVFTTGHVSYDVVNISEADPPVYPVGQYGSVTASFLFGPSGVNPSYLQLTKDLYPSAKGGRVQDGKTESFSFQAYNDNSVALPVSFEIGLNIKGQNSTTMVPEPATLALWFGALPIALWRYRKGLGIALRTRARGH